MPSSGQRISPGVYTKIIDLSEYVRNVPSTVGFIAVISEKGPDNQLVFTNARDFYLDFGEPNFLYVGKEYGQGPYVASSFLKESDSLYVVRCLPDGTGFITDPDDEQGQSLIPETPAAWANLIISAENPIDAYGTTDGTSTVYVDSSAAINTVNELDTILNDTDVLDTCIIFYGVGRGEWYNNFKIRLSRPENPTVEGKDIYILDIYQRQNDDDINLTTGARIPQYEIVATYKVSLDANRYDTSGESMWIEDVVNRYFRYLKCKANKDACKAALDNNAVFSLPFAAGAVQLQHGSSGSLFQEGTNRINPEVATRILTNAYSGDLSKTDGTQMWEVLDTDNNYFTIILDGGYPADVKESGIHTLVQSRQDCVALIDNGDNATTATALTARANTNDFNTKYMALYEPYTKIYDEFTGRDIWVTPVYHMANIVPYTDNVSELWYAPAGFNRATISSIKEMRFSPLQGERDLFYMNQINPIVKFNVGYTVYGQLTTQKRPTALQDLNIVRLVLYIKRALEQFCKFYIFELNDAATWGAISDNITKFLKVIQNKRGLYSFAVEVGADDYEIKSKTIHVNVTLNPTRVVEQIQLNFYIV